MDHHRDLARRPTVGLKHSQHVSVGQHQAGFQGKETAALNLAAVGQLDLEVDRRLLDFLKSGAVEFGAVRPGSRHSQQCEQQQAGDAADVKRMGRAG